MRKLWMICLVVVCQVLGLCRAGTQAVKTVEAEDDDTIQVRRLTLTPMPEQHEALGIRLLPRVDDMENANAVILYQNAAAMCPEDDEDELLDKIAAWHAMPTNQWPRGEINEALDQFKASFRLIEMATACSRCEWNMSPEASERLSTPSRKIYRRIAWALSLKLRIEIADGQVGEALATLTHGLAMARGLGERPSTEQTLLALAIGGLMLRPMGEFLAMPDAPNLYWALSELPVPLVSLRQSLSDSCDLLHRDIPELRGLDQEILSDAQALALVTRVGATISKRMFWSIGPSGISGPSDIGSTPLAWWVMLHYVDARDFLAERGMATSRIDSMPAAQAVMLYLFQEFKEIRDDMFKWYFLPYAEQRVRADEYATAPGRAAMERGLKSNFFVTYLPALARCRFLETRICREVEMFRLIEALRLHAAANLGTFPETLEDVSIVPISSDPVTGDAFVYVYKDNQHVRVEAPICEEQRTRRPVFELTLRTQP